LALVDPELRSGQVATTGLGLPLALCGGFALTYTVEAGGTKHAVRCFHKQSDALEKRYRAISKKLRSLRSPYFVEFEFQRKGVLVNGGAFPIVKMEWASGVTLGEFVERNHRDGRQMVQLGASLRRLAAYIEAQSFAHGDVQPGNVMVSRGGETLQLIDYDGMFVDALKGLGSAELGHRNFQHPRRTRENWDGTLDRFSFIALDLAVRALVARPELWDKTQSDGDGFLFKANDFADPAKSFVFGELFRHGSLSGAAKNLASLCRGPVTAVPALEDFLAAKGIPSDSFTVATKPPTSTAYLSAFEVLDAKDYSRCLGFVGERIELIGQIVGVKSATTSKGRPYVFLNFGPWRGQTVMAPIWSDGLAALNSKPDETWVGRWVSVTGLLDPPIRNRRHHYTHLSVSINEASQLHTIDKVQAQYRLSGANPGERGETEGHSRNREILDGMRGGRSSGPPAPAALPPKRPATTNQRVLQAMKRPTARPPRPQPVAPRGIPPPPPVQQSPVSPKRSRVPAGCLWSIGIAVVIVLWLVAKAAGC
jgi:hypothetical protein